MTTEDLTEPNCWWNYDCTVNKFLVYCRACNDGEPTKVDALRQTLDRKTIDGGVPVTTVRFVMLDWDLIRCKHCTVKFRFE
jgi:hypothetical protein